MSDRRRSNCRWRSWSTSAWERRSRASGASTGPDRIGKQALFTGGLRAMIDALPGGLIGLRDRALLLVGFAGAFQPSKLAATQVEHFAQTRHTGV